MLFQPRWTCDRLRVGAVPSPDDIPSERGVLLLAALEAVVIGDASRFHDLFTDDLAFSSPHLVAESLEAVQHAVGSPEDSLSEVQIVLLALDAVGDKVIAEWRLEAMFTRPVLFDDRLLIEPTGGAVHLAGASVAEFRGSRIRAFRHYFDDSELMARVPGAPRHLRWRADG